MRTKLLAACIASTVVACLVEPEVVAETVAPNPERVALASALAGTWRVEGRPTDASTCRADMVVNPIDGVREWQSEQHRLFIDSPLTNNALQLEAVDARRLVSAASVTHEGCRLTERTELHLNERRFDRITGTLLIAFDWDTSETCMQLVQEQIPQMTKPCTWVYTWQGRRIRP